MHDDNEIEPGLTTGKAKRGNAAEREIDKVSMFGAVPTETSKPNALDSEKNELLHNRLMGYYQQELDRQQVNRHEQAIDEDFYDNIQWTDADAQVLKDRGQIPLVYNVIATAVDWVLGSERRMRTDYKILPRNKAGGKQAERKSQLLKYLSDVNRTAFDVSRAFADSVKVGIGWIEDGAQDDDDGETVYSRYESWRNMLWDSAGVERDLADCRYLFRSKWVDADVATAIFPDRAGLIESSMSAGDSYGMDLEYGDEAMDAMEDELENNNAENSQHYGSRDRVRLIECWFRLPTTVKRIRGGDFSGEIYDETSRGHQKGIETGQSVVVDKVMMRMHVAIMTTGGLLYLAPSPYRHNQYPFTPIWGKVRGRNNMPYGIIRGLRDIQDDINKRASKALHILSTNKTIMDEGAVEDLNEFMEEVARPDAVIVKKQGKALDINAERELAPAHLELMSRSIQMIQQVSGITDENMGRQTNATSGKAIQARQDQGSLATAHYFDSLRMARQIQGEKQLVLVEQYFTEAKQFRITNMRGTPEYVEVNDGTDDSDISVSKADFIISEVDWNSSLRQSQLQELLEVMQQIGPVAPQVVMSMLDLVVESMDIAGRDELVKRIRAITGMRDPDAEELTPEEQQQMAAKQAEAEMQQRAQLAQIEKAEGEAAYAKARAQKSGAEIAKIQAGLASDNVNTQKAALEAAIQILQAPGVTPISDSILHESGFVSRTEQEQDERKAQQAQAQQQAMAEQQAMAQQQQQQSSPQQPGQEAQPQ